MRRVLAVLGTFALMSGWLAAPGSVFALPAASVTLTASPNPSVTTATFKIVVKLSSSASNVLFHLETSGGFGDPDGSSCTPAPNCTITGAANNPHWSYAGASGTFTATFTTHVNPAMVVRFYSDGGISVTNPPTVRMKDPKVTTKLTRSPTGVVMPGDTIHISATSTTNASPLTNRQWVVLPTSGVDTPTSLSADAQFESWGAVDQWTTLDPSASFSFDIKVTADIGTKLVFKGYFDAYDPQTTMSFTVGVAPTPHPTATPKPTKKPTQSVAPTDPPTEAPTVTPAGSLAPPSPSPIVASSTSPESTSTPAPDATNLAIPTPGPETAPIGDSTGGGFLVGLVIALVGGLAIVVGLRIRLNRRGAP